MHLKFQRHFIKCAEQKWNESGSRPPFCTYRLNWAKRTSWGWWDDWDDTVLQTQDSKFEPWRSEAEHATSRSRRLPTILTFSRGWGRNIFISFKPQKPEMVQEPRGVCLQKWPRHLSPISDSRPSGAHFQRGWTFWNPAVSELFRIL